ncbi:MAG: glycosyltransferase family 4 protein [Candidatus Bathyarchaeia archaeon]
MNVLNVATDSSLAAGNLDTVFARSRFQLLEEWESISIVCPKPSQVNFQNTERLAVFPCRSSSYIGFLRSAAARIREIVDTNDIDVVIAQDPFVGFSALRALRRRRSSPLIVELHADYLDNKPWKRERWVNRVMNQLGKYVVKRADAVRVVSHKILRDVQALSVPPERILYLPSAAVDVDFFKPTQNPRDSTILCVARLVKQKALHLAIEAFALLKKPEPQAVLKIVGRGVEEPRLRQIASGLGVDGSVDFLTDYVSSGDLAKLYASSWVYLNTAYYEGGPRSVFEAMACGTPAVSTPVGLAAEFIRHAVNGYVTGWTPRQISAVLARAFKDTTVRPQLEENARTTVVTHCGWRETYHQYAQGVREFTESYKSRMNPRSD